MSALTRENLEAFDVETWGKEPAYALQPFRAAAASMVLHNGERQAWLTTCASARFIADGESHAWGIITPVPSDLSFLLERWVRQGKWVVCWNAPFDVAWLIAYGLRDLVYQVKWLDGMLLHRHLNNAPKYREEGRESMGLKAVVAKRWPERAGYEEDVDFGATSEEGLSKLLDYNMDDARNTLELTWENIQKMPKAMLRNALIEAASIPMVAETMIHGVYADTEEARQLSEVLENKAKQAFVTLKVTTGVSLNSDELTKILASPAKLRKLLFEEWGLPVQNLTDTGQPSTDKEALTALAVLDRRAKHIHEYREAMNNRTKFAEGVLDSVAYNGDGRTRPQARIFGTYCVPGDVEVLTREGWRPLETWSGGDIAQVHPDRRIEFLPAERFVGPIVDQWVEIDAQGLKGRFTHGHTMPYLSQRYGRWCTLPAGEMLTGSRTWRLPVAGVAQLNGRLTPDQMRVLAMVQADGSFCRDRGRLKFMFKKDRKVQRARANLQAADLPFREYVAPAYPDRTEIHVGVRSLPPWLTPAAKELGPWLLDTTADGLAAFVDELVHWDGSSKGHGVRYSSAKRENAEWVAIAAALAGRKVSRVVRDGAVWGCTISHSPAERSVRSHLHVREVVASERAYCATTQTGFWLARSRGHVFITGNTGRMTYSSKVKG